LIGLQFDNEDAESEDDEAAEAEDESKVKSFNPDLHGDFFGGLSVYVTDDDSEAGSDEDLQVMDHLTINSFDFPEEGEDEDESYEDPKEPEKQDRLELVRLKEGEAEPNNPPQRQASRRLTQATMSSTQAPPAASDSRVVQASLGGEAQHGEALRVDPPPAAVESRVGQAEAGVFLRGAASHGQAGSGQHSAGYAAIYPSFDSGGARRPPPLRARGRGRGRGR
jgi:hypothetical protein